MVVRELLTMLGFDVDTHGLKKYDEAIKGVMKTTALVSTAIVGAISGLGFAFFRGAGEIEQVEVAFSTMLGSMEQAKILIADITKLAEKTPFELMGLVRSSKQLLAFGIEGDKIIETMTNLGNISAGIGMNKLTTIVRAFGKIRAKGRASMEELNMLLEAGVPVLDEIAKKLDMEVGPALFRMVEKGVVSFDIVNRTIKEMSTGTGKFANLMIKQSKTLFGLISNIKDVFTNLVNAIGKDLLPEGKRLAVLFLDWITLNKELIKIKVADFYLGVLKAIQNVVALFEEFKVVGNIRDAMRLLMAILRVFGDVINDVFGRDGKTVIEFLSDWFKANKELASQNIIKFVRVLADIFEILLRAVKSVVKLIIELGLLLVDTFGGAGVIGPGLKNLAEDFLAVADAITATLKAIREADEGKKGEALGEGLFGVLGKIGDLFQGILKTFGEISDLTIAAQTGGVIDDFLWEIEKELKHFKLKVEIIFKSIGLAIENVFIDAFDRIQEKIEFFSEIIKALLLDVVDLLDKFGLLETGKAILQKAGDAIETGKGKFEEFIKGDTIDSVNSKPVVVEQNIKVDATIAMPPGTAEDQEAFLKRSAEKIIGDSFYQFSNIDGIPAVEAQ